MKKLISLTAVLFFALFGPILAGTAAQATTPPSSPAADASAASNDQAYVYWSYWTGGASGAWEYATEGAGTTIPADGTSNGWRFGVGSTPKLTEQPSAGPDFATICGSTAAAADSKRVAVTVDYGTAAEAASGTTPPAAITGCASVPTSANGLQVLQAVTSLRQSSDGQVCGITGYPASGCGYQVSLDSLLAAANGQSPSAAASPASSSSSSSSTVIGFVVGGIVIVAIIVVTVVVSKQRKNNA